VGDDVGEEIDPVRQVAHHYACDCKTPRCAKWCEDGVGNLAAVIRELIRKAVEAEREACAKIAEDHVDTNQTYRETCIAQSIATYVRARGKR
jgi:hypothetical protein